MAFASRIPASTYMPERSRTKHAEGQDVKTPKGTVKAHAKSRAANHVMVHCLRTKQPVPSSAGAPCHGIGSNLRHQRAPLNTLPPCCTLSSAGDAVRRLARGRQKKVRIFHLLHYLKWIPDSFIARREKAKTGQLIIAL